MKSVYFRTVTHERSPDAAHIWDLRLVRRIAQSNMWPIGWHETDETMPFVAEWAGWEMHLQWERCAGGAREAARSKARGQTRIAKGARRGAASVGEPVSDARGEFRRKASAHRDRQDRRSVNRAGRAGSCLVDAHPAWPGDRVLAGSVRVAASASRNPAKTPCISSPGLASSPTPPL